MKLWGCAEGLSDTAYGWVFVFNSLEGETIRDHHPHRRPMVLRDVHQGSRRCRSALII